MVDLFLKLSTRAPAAPVAARPAVLLLRRLQSCGRGSCDIGGVVLRQQWHGNVRRLSTTETARKRRSDPLRILFCGSDEFSCAALLALDQLRRGIGKRSESNDSGASGSSGSSGSSSNDISSSLEVRSIDVVVRPPKPAGRGMHLRAVAAHELAERLCLPVHTLDSFCGWNLPQPSAKHVSDDCNGYGGKDKINLIVAVSFGLWIPSRLIKAAKYGGLNLHPSLLPNLRGAAPLPHAILHGYSHTGVTLQTLSTAGFDRGERLLQVPGPPGHPISADATPKTLLAELAPLAADALVESLRNGLHVPPYRDGGWTDAAPPSLAAGGTLPHVVRAPKLSKHDQRVRWRNLLSASGTVVTDLDRQWRATGGLWTEMLAPSASMVSGNHYHQQQQQQNSNPLLLPYLSTANKQISTIFRTALQAGLTPSWASALARDDQWIRRLLTHAHPDVSGNPGIVDAATVPSGLIEPSVQLPLCCPVTRTSKPTSTVNAIPTTTNVGGASTSTLDAVRKLWVILVAEVGDRLGAFKVISNLDVAASTVQAWLHATANYLARSGGDKPLRMRLSRPEPVHDSPTLTKSTIGSIQNSSKDQMLWLPVFDAPDTDAAADSALRLHGTLHLVPMITRDDGSVILFPYDGDSHAVRFREANNGTRWAPAAKVLTPFGLTIAARAEKEQAKESLGKNSWSPVFVNGVLVGVQHLSKRSSYITFEDDEL